MGYRSNLYFKCTNDALPELYTTLQQAELANNIQDMMQDSSYTTFTMFDLKWYDSYPDVQLVNTKLAELGEHDKATMIREGEESGDIETYGAEPHYLDLSYWTSLELDGFGNGDDALPILRNSHPELFI